MKYHAQQEAEPFSVVHDRLWQAYLEGLSPEVLAAFFGDGSTKIKGFSFGERYKANGRIFVASHPDKFAHRPDILEAAK